METTGTSKPMNIGRKISRVRELRGIKQEALAIELGVSQQSVSRMEQCEVLDNEMLERIAKALGVTSEAIKAINEEAIIQLIQNNYEGSNQGATNVGPAHYMNYQCTFNPLEKLMEVIEENKKLYERLVQSEQEKVELLKSLKS